MLKKLKSNPFTMPIWLVIIIPIHILLFRSKVNYDYQMWQRMLMALLAIALAFPVHEFIHFIFMKLFFKGNVAIKIGKDPIGVPTLVTVGSYDKKPPKWQFAVIYLAPFLFLTLIPDVVFLFSGNVALIFFIVSVCNCAGCLYDILDTLIVINEREYNH